MADRKAAPMNWQVARRVQQKLYRFIGCATRAPEASYNRFNLDANAYDILIIIHSLHASRVEGVSR